MAERLALEAKLSRPLALDRLTLSGRFRFEWWELGELLVSEAEGVAAPFDLGL